jgi:hypothetical protein
MITGRPGGGVSSLWEEARSLGVFPWNDPLAGIEADIRIAQALSSCSTGFSKEFESVLPGG